MKAIKLVGFLSLTILLQPAPAKDKPGKASQHPGEPRIESPKEAEAKVKWAFSETERRTISGYAANYPARGWNRKGRGLPPGLAKKVERDHELPPGWQKKCVPGEVMPVEVFEKCHPLPHDLVIKLPTPPSATITVSIGGQIVRLIKATREILDVFNLHS